MLAKKTVKKRVRKKVEKKIKETKEETQFGDYVPGRPMGILRNREKNIKNLK